MEENKRPKWSVPELIVLYRGTEEENVLLGCKQNVHSNGGGPGTTHLCEVFETPCNNPAPS